MSNVERNKPGARATGSSPCRIILETQPQTGERNMALDAALLESAVRRGECMVRIYRWSVPTVSLGYFQKPGELDPSSPLTSFPTVKRLTGGGAVLHHHEWTYSCAVPAGHPAIRMPGELYAAVHRRIIAVLAAHGVSSQLRSGAASSDAITETESSSPFLCFFRGDPNDIVLNGRKIVGSAQRRRKGAVLQHGSILLRQSEFAPEILGIADLVRGFDPPDTLGEQLIRSIAREFSDKFIDSAPSHEEREFSANKLGAQATESAARNISSR